MVILFDFEKELMMGNPNSFFTLLSNVADTSKLPGVKGKESK